MQLDCKLIFGEPRKQVARIRFVAKPARKMFIGEDVLDARVERYSNRLVNEPHGERDWHDRLYRPEQGQERFREYAHAQPFAKRININPDGSRLRAP